MKEIHVKLGEALKLERERLEISIEDASDQLKISQTNLEYVELGEVDNAPSSLYFSMFAKSYAEFLGVDYTATLDAIKDELGVSDFDPRALETSSDDSSKGSSSGPEKKTSEKQTDGESNATKKLLNWFGIIILAFIGALLIWIFVFDDSNDSIMSNSNNVTSDSLSEPSDEASEQTITAEPLTPNYEYGTPPTKAPDPIRFRMIASSESWATILADGDTVIFRNLVPAREYNLQADHRLRISIANPGVVKTFINDTEVDLRNPETRRVSRVMVNQINLSQVLVPPEIIEPVVTPVTRRSQPVDTPAVTADTTSNDNSLSQTLPRIPFTTEATEAIQNTPADALGPDSAGGL